MTLFDNNFLNRKNCYSIQNMKFYTHRHTYQIYIYITEGTTIVGLMSGLWSLYDQVNRSVCSLFFHKQFVYYAY